LKAKKKDDVKILYLTDANLAAHNAPQIHVSQFLKHWYGEGSEVLLRAPRTQMDMPKFDFPHEWLPYLGIRLLGGWLFNHRLYRQLKHELKEKRWDVVYTRQISTAPALYRLCKRFNVPIVCEVNGFLLENYETGGARAWKLGMVERMERTILDASSLIIVPYDALKKRMIHRYGLLENKVIVVENGVDLKLFKPASQAACRQLLDLNQDDYLVGFVGSFDFYHDLHTMFQAYERISESIDRPVKYVLVGDGTMRESLECEIRNMDLASHIHFIGAVPNHVVPQYINACDVMVSLQPLERMQKLGEASSLKVKEYLACQAQVIMSHVASQVSSFEGLCVHVEPENSEQFVRAVVSCYEGRTEIRDTRAFIQACSWQASALKLLDVMKKGCV